MQGFDPYILCPICFGPEGEREKRRSLLRQLIDSWTKLPCFVCDGNGEVQASVATKSKLIAKLAERYPQLVAKDAEVAVNAIFDAMTTSLVKGRRIEIRGFGSFGINYRPPRFGRNPKSGERVPAAGGILQSRWKCA